jgi:gas vesicle protein
MILFIIGAMFGGTVGLFTSALLFSAKRGDKDV